jgi:transcriptional regulator with XRE-family HTH domain
VRAATQTASVDDQRIGTIVRAVRIKRRWRQIDLARKAGASSSTISRIERGHFDRLSTRTLRAVAAALDIRLELVARWRAGDLDRLLNARHSQLHELVAESFRSRYLAWTLAPEVSFSIYGERGVIDLLAWNAATRSLLVIELKTDIADVNELMGTFDRKVRLAWSIGADRGWDALDVSGWVIVAPGRTNRERIAAHGAVLRAAFPMDGRGIDAWLRRPAGRCSVLSMWRNTHAGTATVSLAPIRRVRTKRTAAA